MKMKLKVKVELVRVGSRVAFKATCNGYESVSFSSVRAIEIVTQLSLFEAKL